MDNGYEQKGLFSALMLDDARKVFDAGLDSYHIKSQLKVVVSCTLFLSYQPAAPFTIKSNIVFEYTRDFILLDGKSNFQLFSSIENVHLVFMMECISYVHFVYQFSH